MGNHRADHRGPRRRPSVLATPDAVASGKRRAATGTRRSASRGPLFRGLPSVPMNQWTLPVDGYHLTATFGQSSSLWASVHTGLDFAAPSGTPIHAIANGVVTSVGYDGAYGNKTVITLDDGTELWFCHQTSFVVAEGDVVRAGELIGYVGSTGNVTGPHLHLEVRPGAGDPVDPYEALRVHGLQP